MKRRPLLSVIPAASALLSLRSKGAPVREAAFTPAGFAIVVQCWSFKEFTLFESIEMAAAAGAGGVELYPGQKIGGGHGDVKFGAEMREEVLQSVIDHLGNHHVAALNFGVVEIPKDEIRARPVFELAKRLGLYGVTTESIDAIDIAEKLAAQHDIKVCFHNHPKRPLYKLWNPDFIFDAVKDRHENLGLCADTGHWASSGLDPLEVIRKVAPRVRSFHLKDRESIAQWTHDRPFGSGIIDLVAILDEVRHHGFAGNVSIEYEHNWKTNLPEVAQCAGYLRAYAEMRG